ncbi:hypothetical protein H0A70_07920 [Alcaligenaceae bacterium]|nr:hypothetical protein [Alcaligenaceae bacterium]
MFNARALLAAMLGVSISPTIPPMSILPEPMVREGKKRRKVDHFRNRLKHTHSGYPGAKLDRKAILGEVGGRHPK